MHTFKAMNTTIHTFGLSPNVQKDVEFWFDYIEKILSRFKNDSELSQFNQSKGELFLPSDLFYEILTLADFYHRETNGVFNPYLGRVLSDLGYNKSFEQLADGKAGESETIRMELSSIPGDAIEINQKMRSVKLLHGSVDLGGIAKGWSAKIISEKLKNKGIATGVIDAGGDMIFWGENSWQLSIANPFNGEKDLINAETIPNFSIATSSIIKRKWKNNKNETFHHIVDPKTLKSSVSDLVQVSIFSTDLAKSEVISKVFLILGWENGIAWIQKKYPGIGVIGLKEDRSLVFGGNIEHYIIKRGN